MSEREKVAAVREGGSGDGGREMGFGGGDCGGGGGEGGSGGGGCVVAAGERERLCAGRGVSVVGGVVGEREKGGAAVL